MISTTSLTRFYWYYAMWAARGHRIMWAEKNGWYFVIKLGMAKLNLK